MNRVHKTLWSASAQCWQAVPETAKAAGKRSVKSASGGVLATVVMGLALTGGAGAQSPPATTQLPTGGTVARGNASISQTATAQAAAMTVNQSSQRAVINWDSFNLGSAASIHFVQPNAQAVTLNRVNDNNPSQIFGRITSNGQVFLTNPNGVYFSPTASVDVGALVATTHGISDDHFMAGKYLFERNGATGKVVNEGRISAALGGYVALLAPEVQNAGVVVARAGTVALAAGEAISLQVQGGGLAGITTTPSTIATLIENKLAVQAPDGQIILSAVALNKLQAGVIKNSGTLEANSLVSKGGKIFLEGDDITLASTSQIEAKGPTGGGTVLVGGDWQGSGDMRQAKQVTMAAGATIDASATDKGDGGKVVLWSDVHHAGGVTRANGSIKAEAGPNGGDGGKVETSGHYLNVDGIQVSTRSSQGQAGDWLLDPYNINIISSGTAFVDGTGDDTFLATATSSIKSSDLTAALNAGSNVTVSTGAAGSAGIDTGNITVSSALSWSTNKTLSLLAAGGVTGSGTVTMSGGGVLVINQAGTSTFYGAISGTGRFTKDGEGTLTLGGNNSYTGTTTINGGLIKAGSTTALGTNSPIYFADVAGVGLDVNGNAISVGTLSGGGANGGNITLGPRIFSFGGDNGSGDFAGTISNTVSINPITKTGTGTQTLSGASTFVSSLIVSAGTLKLGGTGSGNNTPLGLASGVGTSIAAGATLDFNGYSVAKSISTAGTVINSSPNAITLTGNLTASGSTTIKADNGAMNLYTLLGGNQTVTLDGSTRGSFSGDVGTTSSKPNIVKKGAGTWTFNGTNIYLSTNPVDIQAGTLQLGPNVVNYSVSSTSIGNGATFDVATNSDITITSAFSSSGTLTKSGGASSTLRLTSTASTFSGPVTVASGVLAAGTATSSGSNSYFGSGAITVQSGSALDLSGKTIPNNITLNGTGINGNGALINAATATSATSVLNGTLTLASDSSIGGGGIYGITLNNTSASSITSNNFSLTLGGATGGTLKGVFGGTGGITKTGSGTWTLSGANTYSGETAVNAGTLTVTASTGLGSTSGGTTVAYGATLALNFSTSPTTISENVHLSGPGVYGSSYAGAMASTGTAAVVNYAGTMTLDGTTLVVGSSTLSRALNITNSIQGGMYNFAKQNTVNLAATPLAAASTGSVMANYAFVRPTTASLTYGDTPNISYALYTTGMGTVLSAATATGTPVFTGAPAATSNAGSYQLTYGSGLTAVNYALFSGNAATLSVNPKTITLAATPTTKIYGATDPVLSATVTAGTLSAADAMADVTGVMTRSAGQNVGNYNMALGTGIKAANYTITFDVNNQAFSITKAPLTVTANNAIKTYGDANPTLSATVSGFVNGETLATSGVSGVGSASTTATTTTGAGNAVITAGVGTLAASNYDFSNLVNGTLTINKAALMVTANNAIKTYGDANPTLSATVSGFVNGETLATSGVSGAGSATTTATTSTGAGNATITAGVGTLAAINYDFSNLVNGTLTINKAPLTVTANNAIKTYGDANPTLSATVSGFVNGETLATSGVSGTGSASTTATTATAAGNATITAGVGTLAANNYDFSNLVNGTLTINKAPLTVTANNAIKTYGGANPTLSATVSGFKNSQTLATSGVSGAGSATTTATTTTGAGNATITAGVGTLAASNYDFSNLVNGTLTINKAPLTVTANNAIKTYGDANPTLSATVSGFVNGETLATSGVSGVGSASTTATTTTGAGNAVITAGVGTLAASNYDFSNLVNGTLTINKAALMVTANNAIKTYGDANPTLSATVSGFVNGETLATSGVSGAGSATTTATTTTGAGNAVITAGVGTLAASNYDFSNLVNGTLTINKAALTVTANNAIKTYGDANPTLSATVSGFVNGETLATSGVSGTGSASTTATTATAAGNATITAGVGTLAANNYDFSNLVNGTLTINKAPLTVTANNAIKTYGGANPTLSATVSGFKNSQTLATSGVSGAGSATTTATTTTGAGNATITAGVGTLAASNYDFSNLVNGTLTINKAPLTVTANNAIKTYGDANPALSATVSGFVNGETLATSGVSGAGSATTTATTTTGAGNAVITAGVGTLAASNYDFSNLVNGTLTINKAALTVTANNAIKTYGDANPTLSATVSGFVNGETLATSGVSGAGSATTTATTTTGAGNATITAGVGTLAASNYDFSNLVNGTLTIQAAKAADSEVVLVVQKVVQEVAPLAAPVVNNPVISVTTNPPVELVVPVPPGPPPEISIAPQAPVVAEAPPPPPPLVDVLPTPSITPPTQLAALPPSTDNEAPQTLVVPALPPVVEALPAPTSSPPPVVATLSPSSSPANADNLDNPDNKDRPATNVGPRVAAATNLQGEQVAYLRPADASGPSVPPVTTVRAETAAPPASTALVVPALPQAPVQTSTSAPATASVQAPAASPEAPRPAPTVSSVIAPASAPSGTGVLAITILRGNNAQPTSAGVAFEQNADSVSLRAADAPPLPPSSERLVFNDRLTTFMVANSNGTMVEFQGSLVNNRMVIVAPSDAAKLVAQTDMNTVLAAAVTSLGRESRVMLAQLDGVVIDLR